MLTGDKKYIREEKYGGLGATIKTDNPDEWRRQLYSTKMLYSRIGNELDERMIRFYGSVSNRELARYLIHIIAMELSEREPNYVWDHIARPGWKLTKYSLYASIILSLLSLGLGDKYSHAADQLVYPMLIGAAITFFGLYHWAMTQRRYSLISNSLFEENIAGIDDDANIIKAAKFVLHDKKFGNLSGDDLDSIAKTDLMWLRAMVNKVDQYLREKQRIQKT